MKPQFKCNDLFCKVHVEDTDFQGVVYHANYLKYFERARSEFLIEHEISQAQALQAQESFIVKKLDVEFFYPAVLDDNLIIYSTAVLLSKARMHFLQSVRTQKMIYSLLMELLKFVILMLLRASQKHSLRIY